MKHLEVTKGISAPNLVKAAKTWTNLAEHCQDLETLILPMIVYGIQLGDEYDTVDAEVIQEKPDEFANLKRFHITIKGPQIEMRGKLSYLLRLRWPIFNANFVAQKQNSPFAYFEAFEFSTLEKPAPVKQMIPVDGFVKTQKTQGCSGDREANLEGAAMEIE